jgi:hypothetical protein
VPYTSGNVDDVIDKEREKLFILKDFFELRSLHCDSTWNPIALSEQFADLLINSVPEMPRVAAVC